MKQFVFIVNKKKNDRDGGPRSMVSVYKVQQMEPFPLSLIARGVLIGYRSEIQAVIETLIIYKEITREEITLPDGYEACEAFTLREKCGIVIQEVSA